MRHWPQSVVISVPRHRRCLPWLLGGALLASTLGDEAGGVRPVTSPARPHLRINQVGYPSHGPKLGIAMAAEPLPERFDVVEPATGRVVFTGNLRPVTGQSWGKFGHVAELDFSALRQPGQFRLRVGGVESLPVRVDGPVYENIFRSLKGVQITEPDPLADFQDARAVYHDDFQDYASNEPTMDGTASAILMLSLP